jgi:hypothetical protein
MALAFLIDERDGESVLEMNGPRSDGLEKCCDCVTTLHQNVLAVINSVSCFFVSQAERSPPQSLSAFENERFATRFNQPYRCRKTRESTSYDDNVFVHLMSQFFAAIQILHGAEIVTF